MTEEEIRKKVAAFATGCRVWRTGTPHLDPANDKWDRRDLKRANGDTDVVDWEEIEICVLLGREAYEKLEKLQDKLLYAPRYAKKGKMKPSGDYLLAETVEKLVKESR